ncbi:MAG TPA: TRAP transporter small permease [Caldimonas sp.]|jgi:TRAP-type C4-dicarboxylate transport system permease small subunit
MRAEPAAPSDALARLRRRYGAVLEIVVIALVVTLALEVTLGVVFRAIGRSLSWYDEIATVLLAWLTFYGSALASVRRAHISCPEVVEQASPAAQRVLAIVAQLLVIAFFALLGWVGASILPIIAGDSLVSVPAVSMAVVQSVIPISCVLIVIAEVLHLLALLRAGGFPATASASAQSDGLH